MAKHPDWGRVGANPPTSFSALGDPTRWGGTYTIDPLDVPDGAPLLFESGQIVNVQCRDSYPRAWTLIGTMTGPAEFFGLPNILNPGANYWLSAAFVSMGVGQIQIIHSFNLRAIIDADIPFYWNGGLDQPFAEEAGNGNITVPFIMPGAVVGTAISIRVFHRFRIAGSGDLRVRVSTSLLVTPFDSGVRANAGGPLGTGAIVP